MNMVRIFDKHGKLLTNPKLILSSLHDFYSELYSNRDLPNHHVLSDAFLDHCLLPTLSEDSKNNCEGALTNAECFILGNPGAASRDDGIFMGESLQQERESPWALTLTERVPEAFEIPPSDWPENYFSGQSAKRNSQATLMSSYTRLFSSSYAVEAWPVQREHF